MTQTKQIQSETKFNSILLGISVLIFLSTFSYWFIGEDSQGSLINVFLKRNISNRFEENSPYNDFQKLEWGVFYGHLLVTAIGLLIYYNSGITKWIGKKISFYYPVASFFYKNNSLAKGILLVFKIIIGFLIVYSLYNILIEITKGLAIPISGFSTFICLFFIATTGWYIRYPKPEEKPDFVGSIDNRDKTMWLRLCDNQIAYVQNSSNKEDWFLVKSKREVDLSYTEAYVFYEKSFSNYLKDLVISEDIVGRLMYSFRVEPLLTNFPNKLSIDKLQLLNNRFRNSADLEKLIFLSIDKKGLLQKTRKETFEGLNKYFDTDPNILKNQGHQMNYEFENILKSYTNFGDISLEISKEIESKIYELFGTEKLFKISFEITKTEFNMDEMLKEIIDSRKKMSATVLQGNIDTQKKIIDTAVTLAATPGASASRIDNLIGFASKLNQSFSSTNTANLLENKNDSKQLANPIKLASENVINAIFEVMDKDPTPDVLTEAVSKSTSYISDNQIPIDDFVKRFFQKMSDEKVERTQEAYRQLAEDTFTEFIEKR